MTDEPEPEVTEDDPVPRPSRCPKCGAPVQPTSEVELCDRCMLVRSLEVERATVYRRFEP